MAWWALVSGMFTGAAGIFFDPHFPEVSLVLFSAGALLLFAGILPWQPKEVQQTPRPETLPKVELRRVTYEEKLALGKRTCELILNK